MKRERSSQTGFPPFFITSKLFTKITFHVLIFLIQLRLKKDNKFWLKHNGTSITQTPGLIFQKYPKPRDIFLA